MNFQILDELEWVFEDSKVSPAGAKAAELAAPRGGYASFLVITDAPPMSKVSVSFSGDKSLGQPDAYVLHTSPVEENSGWKGFTNWEPQMESQVTRRAPFRVFDAMRPVDAAPVRDEKLLVILVQFPISGDAKPGKKSGTVSITANNEAASVPVTVEVFSASVAKRETLKVTNWFSVPNIAERHGLKPWSQEHWAMVEKYGRLMRKARQNMFWLSGMVEGKKDEKGVWKFDFSKAVALIEMYSKLGFKYLEGPHLGGCKKWGDSEIYLALDKEQRPGTPEGYAGLAAFLKEWGELLRKRKWIGKYYQHISDEPTPGAQADYQTMACAVRKFLPGVPIIDAVEFPNLAAAVDVWVPKSDQYEKDRAIYESHRSLGGEIWHYTCCVPGGPHMNRFLDFHLLRTRFLHWGNYLYDLKGYLHWGLNHWQPKQNPFEMSIIPWGGTNKLPAGDTHIVYPGSDGPWSSVRFEAMRSGIEDYELFLLAEERVGREKALVILRKCVQSFHEFSQDVPNFRKAYRELLAAASGKR